MPLIKIETSVACDKQQTIELAKQLSSIVAECMGKPETYVATVVETDALVTFGGEVVPGAFVDVRGIGGFNKDVNTQLTIAICSCLNKLLDISSSHVYINFTDIAAVNWGCDNKTFG